MSINVNGCTMCNAVGQEVYEYYKDYKGRKRIQYDYRHTDGELFACIAESLDDARSRRDEWIARKG